MSNQDVALSSFYQLARHWKQGETFKLYLSCEAGSLQLQISANLDHPDEDNAETDNSKNDESTSKIAVN